METPTLDMVLAQVRAALEHDDVAGAVNILQEMRPPDQAELFAELDDQHQVALLPGLSPAESADILEELDNEAVIPIVEEMAPDEAADLLRDIEPEQAKAILAGLDDPGEVHPLLLHPD